MLKESIYRDSYFSTLRSKIKDAEILKKTLRDLGIFVKTDADIRGSLGKRARADVVAVLEGGCDIGFAINSDGTYDIVLDIWGVAQKHNQTQLINLINPKYAVNKIIAESQQRKILKKTKCSRCDSVQINKYGSNQGKQNYICRNCGTQFT